MHPSASTECHNINLRSVFSIIILQYVALFSRRSRKYVSILLYSILHVNVTPPSGSSLTASVFVRDKRHSTVCELLLWTTFVCFFCETWLGMTTWDTYFTCTQYGNKATTNISIGRLMCTYCMGHSKRLYYITLNYNTLFMVHKWPEVKPWD